MTLRLLATLSVAALLVSGCSSQNKYEKQADAITRAVIANNMQPVQSDFTPAVSQQITRVKVAELSDELASQGKYEGLKENPQNCTAGFHCFDVKFEKRPYREWLQMDDTGKVSAWRIHSAT
ncbi:MAG: hypothetical protein M3Y21_06290 [Candidatus Eremiobacteraeota bacterium]|nr:hypothetical protein [Candidatus Eremiobacteraeota bacterium]